MRRINFIIILTLMPFLTAFISDVKKTDCNQAPTNTVAFVKKIVKEVVYRKSSGQTEWDIAKTGTLLEDGGEVKTGSKSLALVLFTDGSGLLRVRENSILNIYGTKKDKSMSKNTFIQQGLIGFEVKKQSTNEEFKFTTPTVVASIRGTDGFLSYGSDSTFTMYLHSGDAVLSGASGCDSLSAGNTITIFANGQCNTRIQNDYDLKIYNSTNRTNIKKVEINTNKGKVAIEYYGPEE